MEYPLAKWISKYLKNFPEKVVKHKYRNAAVTKKVKGECSTFEEILDCLIISTNPVTEIRDVSFNVICHTFPIPGKAYLITWGHKTFIKILNLFIPKAFAASICPLEIDS